MVQIQFLKENLSFVQLNLLHEETLTWTIKPLAFSVCDLHFQGNLLCCALCVGEGLGGLGGGDVVSGFCFLQLHLADSVLHSEG